LGEHHIDVLIRECDSSIQWRGTFVYGEARVQDRYKMWDLMRQLKIKWIILGLWQVILMKLYGLLSIFQTQTEGNLRCRPFEMLYLTAISLT